MGAVMVEIVQGNNAPAFVEYLGWSCWICAPRSWWLTAWGDFCIYLLIYFFPGLNYLQSHTDKEEDRKMAKGAGKRPVSLACHDSFED